MPLEIVATGLFILLLFTISSNNKKPPVVISSSSESYERKEQIRQQNTLTPLLIAFILCMGLYILAKKGNQIEQNETTPVQQAKTEMVLQKQNDYSHIQNLSDTIEKDCSYCSVVTKIRK